MIVGVYIAHAESPDDAKAQCKASVAYRKICREHPSSEWDRRHHRTAHHNIGPAGTEPKKDGVGAYVVEFDVKRKVTSEDPRP